MRVVMIALVLVAVACGGRAPDERFHARGKILGLKPDSAMIHHERIAAVRGYDGAVKPMDSMAMSFARAQTSFAGLAVGDAIDFEFIASYDEQPPLRLVRIAKLPPGTKLELADLGL